MDIYWLWLSNVKGVGPATVRKLVQAFGSPEEVYQATLAELGTVKGMPKTVAETLAGARSLDDVKRQHEHMARWGIRLLPFTDPLYQEQVNDFPGLPAILYYKGQLRVEKPGVAIVGSRRCTAYGKEVTVEAATYLAHNGITVISGLAKGIDGYAHTACLKAGGYTLAFVAHGPEMCYPPEHQSLAQEIMVNGAIISPFPPGTRPRQEYFPLRNKLMSAWAGKVMVVEAGARSGALLTARYALAQQRPVLAVPNSIYVPESKGTNYLLLEGAQVYLEARQLLDDETVCGEVPSSGSRERSESGHRIAQASLSPLEKSILERLEQPIPLEDLLDLFAGNLHEMLQTLCMMELEGKVVMSGQTVRRV